MAQSWRAALLVEKPTTPQNKEGTMTTPPTTTHDPNRLMDAQEERERQAQIEALEMLYNASLMQAAGYKKQLEILGKTIKKNPMLDKIANCR